MDRKPSPQEHSPQQLPSTAKRFSAGLTSASLEGLWLTSVLLSGANCCTRLRLLVSARVSLANFVHPAGESIVDPTTNTLTMGMRYVLRSLESIPLMSSFYGFIYSV